MRDSCAAANHSGWHADIPVAAAYKMIRAKPTGMCLTLYVKSGIIPKVQTEGPLAL